MRNRFGPGTWKQWRLLDQRPIGTITKLPTWLADASCPIFPVPQYGMIGLRRAVAEQLPDGRVDGSLFLLSHIAKFRKLLLRES